MNKEIPIQASGCKSLSMPAVQCNDAKAASAFIRWRVLGDAAKADPSLLDEECFHILKADAWAAFMTAFCGPQ